MPAGGTPQFETHRWKAKHEDAQFLLDAGVHPEEVARRVGINVDTIQKWYERGELVRR